MVIDAGLVEPDANEQNQTKSGERASASINPSEAYRAVPGHLDTLDQAAMSAANQEQPEFTSHSDPTTHNTR